MFEKNKLRFSMYSEQKNEGKPGENMLIHMYIHYVSLITTESLCPVTTNTYMYSTVCGHSTKDTQIDSMSHDRRKKAILSTKRLLWRFFII